MVQHDRVSAKIKNGTGFILRPIMILQNVAQQTVSSLGDLEMKVYNMSVPKLCHLLWEALLTSGSICIVSMLLPEHYLVVEHQQWQQQVNQHADWMKCYFGSGMAFLFVVSHDFLWRVFLLAKTTTRTCDKCRQ